MRTDENRLREVAEKAGWIFTKTKRGHWKGVGPDGGIVIMACTPGDYRSYLNARALLRRHGVDV
jgi:hypothetical protein